MLNVVKSSVAVGENTSKKVDIDVGGCECISNGFFFQSDWSFELDLINLNDIKALKNHLRVIPESERTTEDGVFLSEFLHEFSLDEHKLEFA